MMKKKLAVVTLHCQQLQVRLTASEIQQNQEQQKRKTGVTIKKKSIMNP